MFNCFSCCSSNDFSSKVPDFKVSCKKAKHDTLIVDLEKSHMFNQHVSFKVWVSQLIDFNIQNATVDYDSRKDYYISYRHDEYMSPFDVDLFQSFLENKIFKMEPLYSKLGNNDSVRSIFKYILLEMHNGLLVRLRNHHKAGPDEMKVVKKSDGLAMGLLLCKGRNDDKLRYFFELFREKDVLMYSVELENFLMSMIIISSYSMIHARAKLVKNYPQFKDLESARDKMLDAYEVKDVIRLVEYYKSQLFNKEKDCYTYEELRKVYVEKNLGWIFYPACIRFQLEEHNDIK